MLKTTLQAPANEIEARTKLHELMAYLDRQISAGVATGAGLQPNRSPFFVSACWHAQQPGQWPIMFQSARDALQADGLLGRNLRGADGYLEFARVFRALCEGLGISFWDLEHLCAKLAASPAVATVETDDVEEPDEAPQRERVWLIAPGPVASKFDDFYRDGIVAIGWDYLSDLAQYPDVEAIRQAIQQHRGGSASPTHDALACHQFAHEMQVGDIVFAKRGRREIVGYGVVSSAYRYEPERKSYVHVRSVDWKKRGQWVPRDKPLVTKTLTDIGQYPASRRHSGVPSVRRCRGEPDARQTESFLRDRFTHRRRRRDVFHPETRHRGSPGAVALQEESGDSRGPPGVGKTFASDPKNLLLGRGPERSRWSSFTSPIPTKTSFRAIGRPSGKVARVMVLCCDCVIMRCRTRACAMCASSMRSIAETWARSEANAACLWRRTSGPTYGQRP